MCLLPELVTAAWTAERVGGVAIWIPKLLSALWTRGNHSELESQGFFAMLLAMTKQTAEPARTTNQLVSVVGSPNKPPEYVVLQVLYRNTAATIATKTPQPIPLFP